jgi:hypothetical protein
VGIVVLAVATPVAYAWLASGIQVPATLNTTAIAAKLEVPLLLEEDTEGLVGGSHTLSGDMSLEVDMPGDFIYEISLTAQRDEEINPWVIEQMGLYDLYSQEAGSTQNIFLVTREGEASEGNLLGQVTVHYYGYWRGDGGSLPLGTLDAVLASSGSEDELQMPFSVTVDFRVCQATEGAVQSFFGDDAAAILQHVPEGALFEDANDGSITYAWYTFTQETTVITGSVYSVLGSPLSAGLEDEGLFEEDEVPDEEALDEDTGLGTDEDDAGAAAPDETDAALAEDGSPLEPVDNLMITVSNTPPYLSVTGAPR